MKRKKFWIGVAACMLIGTASVAASSGVELHEFFNANRERVNLKKVAPYDHMVIQNAIYLYFSSTEQFDFSEMLERNVKNYTPNDMTVEKKEELLQKLQKLPEEQHFDQQFHPSLSVIKRKMKKTYDVYSGIQIKVTSAVEDLGDVIEAYQANDGKRYLKIRIDNDVTFRTFERKAES